MKLGKSTRVWVLGSGSYGKLGLGPERSSRCFEELQLESQLTTEERVTGFSCTHHMSAFWTSEGRVFVCGLSSELGLGAGNVSPADVSGSRDGGDVPTASSDSVSIPMLLPFPGHRIKQIACGYHFCLALGENAVFSWGVGSSRQLGYDLMDPKQAGELGRAFSVDRSHLQPTPRLVEPLLHRSVAFVAAGDYNAAAIDRDGRLWMWGSNADWQCATEASPAHPCMAANEALLPFLSSFFNAAAGSRGGPLRAISLGSSASLALAANGVVYCWGSGPNLGIGEAVQKGPRELAALAELAVVSVSCSIYHAGAVAADGSVWMWGRGGIRLGLGPKADLLGPTRVPGICNAVSIMCTRDHTSVLCDDRKLYIWGRLTTLLSKRATSEASNLSLPHLVRFSPPNFAPSLEQTDPFIFAHSASADHLLLLVGQPDRRTVVFKKLCFFERQHLKLLTYLYQSFFRHLQAYSSMTPAELVALFSSSLSPHLIQYQRHRVRALYATLADAWFPLHPRDRSVLPCLEVFADPLYHGFFENHLSCANLLIKLSASSEDIIHSLEVIHHLAIKEADHNPNYADWMCQPSSDLHTLVNSALKKLPELPSFGFEPATPRPSSALLPGGNTGDHALTDPIISLGEAQDDQAIVHNFTVPFPRPSQLGHACPLSLTEAFDQVFCYPQRLMWHIQELSETTPNHHPDHRSLKLSAEVHQRILKNLLTLADTAKDDAWARISREFPFLTLIERKLRGRDLAVSRGLFSGADASPRLVLFSPELLVVGATAIEILVNLEEVWIRECREPPPSVGASVILYSFYRNQLGQFFASPGAVRKFRRDLGEGITRQLLNRSRTRTSMFSRTELHIFGSSLHRRIILCDGDLAFDAISMAYGVVLLARGRVFLFDNPQKTCNISPRLLGFGGVVGKAPYIVRVVGGTSRLVCFSQSGELWEATWAFDAQIITAYKVTWLPRRMRSIEVVDISFGLEHWGFVTESGDIYMCGDNSQGALGTGSSSSTSAPTRIKLPRYEGHSAKAKRIVCGGSHTLCLTDAGKVFSFGGDGLSPVLGLGSSDRRASTPRLIAALAHLVIVDIATAISHSCFLSSAGDLYICGPPAFLGTGLGAEAAKRANAAPAWEPVKVTMLDRVTAVHCGDSFTIAVADEEVYSWGSKNHFAQMARATAGDEGHVLPVSLGEQILSIASSRFISAFLVKADYRKLYPRTGPLSAADLDQAPTGELAWWNEGAFAERALLDIPLPPAPCVDTPCGFLTEMVTYSWLEGNCTVFLPFTFQLASGFSRSLRQMKPPLVLPFDADSIDFRDDIIRVAAEAGESLPEDFLLWFEITQNMAGEDLATRTFFVTERNAHIIEASSSKTSGFFSVSIFNRRESAASSVRL